MSGQMLARWKVEAGVSSKDATAPCNARGHKAQVPSPKRACAADLLTADLLVCEPVDIASR